VITLSPSTISRTKPRTLTGPRRLLSEFFSIQVVQAGNKDYQREAPPKSEPEFLFCLSKLDTCHSPISVSSRGWVTIATDLGVRGLARFEPFDGRRTPTSLLLFRTEPAVFDS
jgi:hypothetical protein